MSSSTTTSTTRSLRRRHDVARVLAVAAAGSALLGAVPAAAHADPVSTYAYRNLYLASSNTGGSLFLQVEGGSTTPGAPIVQSWLNANQKWNVTSLADGNHEIVNSHSGQCLTTSGVEGQGL